MHGIAMFELKHLYHLYNSCKPDSYVVYSNIMIRAFSLKSKWGRPKFLDHADLLLFDFHIYIQANFVTKNKINIM